MSQAVHGCCVSVWLQAVASAVSYVATSTEMQRRKLQNKLRFFHVFQTNMQVIIGLTESRSEDAAREQWGGTSISKRHVAYKWDEFQVGETLRSEQ